MLGLIIVLILLSVLLLILAADTTVRFTYSDEPIFVIDVLLIELSLFPAKKRNGFDKNRLDFNEKIKNGYTTAKTTKKALDYLFEHSDVSIHSLKISAEERDPAKLTIYNGYIDFFICTLITYLRTKSLRVSNVEPPFSISPLSGSKKTAIDIAFHTSFYVIAYIFFVYKKDKRRKRVGKIV